ncbi:NirD/YgiW/YdeI family stress tolerance protein [Pseudomonas jinjuensis]|uniref:TIGR00156 family protein n=1 Tax=Pseudomonas jinjuensis TaxID=198616 RepID=A0A1H0KES0_9PSED|nr:NirD/YgiW/YdeI family stress tolerance protein [Pseudomonas jinjuensis]SDO54222.1 TIGR00156 family protein [Pseudomonas jinjuensis]
MKLRDFSLLAATTLFSAATLAAGYTGPGSEAPRAASTQVTTVKAAEAAADDTPAVLEGTVVKRIRGEHYEFKDATGSIRVEIDDEDWPSGAQVSDSTKVRLVGEVDNDRDGREIDVDRVELVQ